MAQSAPNMQLRLGVFRFGPYEVDFHAGELRKSGLRIKIQEQPLQVLEMLLEHPGELVTREQLRQRLWPADTFVDFDHSLNSAVKKLRVALCDEADSPRFVETLARRGYRFIGPVTREQTQPAQIETSTPKPKVGRTGKYRWWMPAVSFFAAIVLIIAVIALNRLWRRSGVNPPAIESVAVLPLQNLSSDPQQEYFADGLTDSLITSLGKLGTVRVISRTSVMRYKGTTQPLSAIARELNVDSIVEGTVLRSGNRVRVTAQLLRAEPEEHLWAESYDGDLSNVLVLQDELSRKIANQIQSKVRSKEERGTAAKIVNTEAYEAYLRGRYFLDKRVEGEARKAIANFEQAIQKDPSYAPAYSGLADCYIVSWAGELADFAKGEGYARQALSLQEDLAEAHASLGIARLYLFDLVAAKRELRRAIELNPNYSMAHHWYGLYLLAIGQTNAALAENGVARQLNPFSVPVNNARAIILTAMERYDEALGQAGKLREIEDNYAPHALAARIYRLKRMHNEALAEEGKRVAILGNQQLLRDHAEIARVYLKSGYVASLERSVVLKKKHYRKPYDASEIAIDYVELGSKDEAFRWLQQAYSDRDFVMLLLRTPELDPLRSDPRFQDLLQRFPVPE